MKEVTYEDWQKNPTPRMMWVWNLHKDLKEQMKVIYFSKQDITYPIVALDSNDIDPYRYMHCAEIEEPKKNKTND